MSKFCLITQSVSLGHEKKRCVCVCACVCVYVCVCVPVIRASGDKLQQKKERPIQYHPFTISALAVISLQKREKSRFYCHSVTLKYLDCPFEISDLEYCPFEIPNAGYCPFKVSGLASMNYPLTLACPLNSS